MCNCEDFPCCGHDAAHLEHEAAVERQQLEYELMEGGVFGEDMFDDINSGRYDDDPSPYDGTYSEE